ncbi:hypothetical protein [Tatumella sp. UBA2305]|uniref:hypothetical protein n=1 Tax=Tatumella sp. UBA2305 TaxID=1947647 RepID=UPI0025E125DD|nr:hypothetical protein [Tatumella sp. UBA2305]
MLDIESEVIDAAETFISLADLAESVWHVNEGRSNYSIVADWLLMRLKRTDNARELPHLVTMDHFYELCRVSNWEPDIDILAAMLLKLRSHNCLPFNHPADGEEGSYWSDDDFYSIGFDREAIAKVMPDEVRSHILAEIIIPGVTDESIPQDIDPLEPMPPTIEAGNSFRGRDTLLEIIAGQATFIGQLSGKHVRATGINKLALARDVYNSLCDFGEGMSIDAEQCRKIIGEALKLKTSLNLDYINLEAERQFAQDHE